MKDKNKTQILKNEIYYADLGNGMDSEQTGYRPVLVLSNNTGNKYSPCVIVAAITSKQKTFIPTHVEISNDFENGLQNISTILLEQIFTISKNRIGNKIGNVSHGIQKQINRALAISLGLN